MSPYQGSFVSLRKRCSFGKVSLMGGSTLPMGKLAIKFARSNPFLVLGVENSRSNSWRMAIHQKNLLVISHWPSIYCMGLEFDTTLILHVSIYW